MKTYVTVCKNTILSNVKHGTNMPTIRVSRGKYGKSRRQRTFTAQGKVTVRTDMKHPLPWGARVWLEVE